MGRFDKALGNSVIQEVGEETSRKANVPKIEYIDIDLLDENPDNENVFNMEGINQLKRSIEDNGFTGAVEVFKKPDGRYEISSGHRRVRAMKELGKKQVPCLVNSMPDDVVRAKRLLDSNITNRTLHPMDYARSIEYYTDYVLKPSGFKGHVDGKCAEYFNISVSAVYKYRSLLKMDPELQELADDPRIPFTGLVSAHRLSEESQKRLCRMLKERLANETDPYADSTVSRAYLTKVITDLLKKEDRYIDGAGKGSSAPAEEVPDSGSGKHKETESTRKKVHIPVTRRAQDLYHRIEYVSKDIDEISQEAETADDRQRVKKLLSEIRDRLDETIRKI